MFDWRWEFVWEILPRLIVATGNTLLAAGLGYAIAVMLGLIIAVAIVGIGLFGSETFNLWTDTATKIDTATN